MSKLFFDHLVIKEEVEFELNLYSLSPEEKNELVEIIDQMLTNHVFNLILNHLPTEKHTDFINLFTTKPHDDQIILDYLKTHAHPDIEQEIKKHAGRVKNEVLTEIRKSRICKTRKKLYNKHK